MGRTTNRTYQTSTLAKRLDTAAVYTIAYGRLVLMTLVGMAFVVMIGVAVIAVIVLGASYM